MNDPPRRPREGIIPGRLRYWVVFQALLDAVVTLTAFIIGLGLFPGQVAGAQTMAFATLVGTELLRAYSARSLRRPLLSIGVFSNRSMVLATIASFLLLLVVIYLPPLQPAFNTVGLGLNEWIVVVPLMFVPFIVVEITKTIYSIRRQRLAD